MHILITGGFGFVGGRLAVHLAQAGHQIVLGSRNAISSPAWLPPAEVAPIEWDDGRALEQSCNGADVVIQAAGMNAQDCATDPVAALAFNGVATARLVAAASRAGVQRFIYLSTAHVYASPLVGKITEDTCPRNLHPYATSHLAGEHAVLSASQRGQIQGIVLRLSNAFGAPMHKDVNCWMLLANDLCRQAVCDRRLTLRSAGLQQRDFVKLHDVGRTFAHILDLPDERIGAAIFNVGGGRSMRVIDMAEMIQARCLAVLGFSPEIIRPESIQGETSPNLNYRIDKLLATGFSLEGDFHAEIDATLRLCNDVFGGGK